MPLADAERRTLLRFAREAIRAHLASQSPPVLVATGGLDRDGGAFVTLRRQRALRGCIGYLEDDRPLVEVVRHCAIAAATGDPRFPPLPAGELDAVALEISVLTPVEAVADVETIAVGRHGLVVRQADRRGLLLPQVAVEQGWDRAMFLAQTCVKAGLAPEAWRRGADIFSFEADVFEE